MSTKFLHYELTLLLAKYGRKAVLRGLSKTLKVSPEQLEESLRQISDIEDLKTPSSKIPPAFSVETLAAQYPEKADLLRILANRFQSKSFLPELRNLRRFFEQHSRDLGHVKSRAESFPKLLRLLADLETSDLDVLCQDSQPGQYSSLGVLADEILGSDDLPRRSGHRVAELDRVHRTN